jgi:hypothetical protein
LQFIKLTYRLFIKSNQWFTLYMKFIYGLQDRGMAENRNFTKFCQSPPTPSFRMKAVCNAWAGGNGGKLIPLTPSPDVPLPEEGAEPVNLAYHTTPPPLFQYKILSKTFQWFPSYEMTLRTKIP